MYLLGKRADKLDADDIKRLVQSAQQETKSLDYKRELKLIDKREFLSDIASMSNTDGGCLVYGIEESKDENGKNTGKPEKIVGIEIDNYDKLAQQIEDTIKGNTDPSITNIALNHLNIDGFDILVIGISKTLGLPTMVTFNENNKFFRRRNSGKYSVDVYELNQMFMQNQVLKESAEKFKLQRIEKVRNGKVFPNLEIRTSFFIHIIPFSFQNDQVLDLTNAEQMHITQIMKPMNLSGWDTMFNVDGFATWSGMNRPKIISYDQLFRNGVYEVYTGDLFEEAVLTNGAKILRMYGQPFIPDVVKKINDGLTVLRRFQLEAPFIISISMFGMKGGVIQASHSWGRPFLVDEIYLPPIILQTVQDDVHLQLSEIYNQLKPIFDIIWQSVAENQSPHYTVN